MPPFPEPPHPDSEMEALVVAPREAGRIMLDILAVAVIAVLTTLLAFGKSARRCNKPVACYISAV